MKVNSKLLWLISIVAFIGVLLILGYSLFQDFELHPMIGKGICPKMIPNYILWVSMILMIIVIVPISYYFISKRLEEKMEMNLSAITKLVDQDIKSSPKEGKINDNSNILKLLNLNERKVVEKLIDNKGSVLQSEISRMPKMTRLRAHRAVKKLEQKEIVTLTSYGKTNKIVLSEDIKNILMKEK